MKQFLILLTILCSFLNSNSQTINFNNSSSISIGYSHIYNSNLYNEINPKDIFTMDINLYAIYLGVGFGNKTLYSEYNGYHGNYSDELNTYIFRIGTSITIGNKYNGISISPYLGTILYTYNEYYTEHFYYYDYYNRYSYHDCYKLELYNKEIDRTFLYGIKIAYYNNLFEIGTHLSNNEIGITIGIRL